jgi:hypothetical protein
MIMYTLCICYTLDPNRVKHFKDYVEHELEAIRNAGGRIVDYFLPTDYAGPTNIAYRSISGRSPLTSNIASVRR